MLVICKLHATPFNTRKSQKISFQSFPPEIVGPYWVSVNLAKTEKVDLLHLQVGFSLSPVQELPNLFCNFHKKNEAVSRYRTITTCTHISFRDNLIPPTYFGKMSQQTFNKGTQVQYHQTTARKCNWKGKVLRTCLIPAGTIV